MTTHSSDSGNFSRRRFIKSAATGATMAAAGGTLFGSTVGAANGPSAVCEGSRDLNIVNGHFLTMDGENSVASAVAVREGRIVEVGRAGALGPCSRTINLKGATVIPGLNDCHVHFLRAGQLPGYQVRIIETATSLAELLQMIAERTLSVPAGQFITNVGGWNINGLAEARFPTVAELDAVSPNHPVYLSTT